MSQSNYDLIYSRTTHSRPVPTQYKAYNQWVGRAFLTGKAINALNKRLSAWVSSVKDISKTKY